MATSNRKTESLPDSELEFPGQVTDAEMADAVVDSEGSPVGQNARQYDDTDLRSIRSFDDAKALAERVMGPLVDATEVIGTGFRVLPTDAKTRLIDVPFVVLAIDFHMGDMGPFVSAMVVTETGERHILNDGSTGIYAQLDEWSVKSGQTGGLLVKGGLRRSEYERKGDDGNVIVNDVTGRPEIGVTYYLNV